MEFLLLHQYVNTDNIHTKQKAPSSLSQGAHRETPLHTVQLF